MTKRVAKDVKAEAEKYLTSILGFIDEKSIFTFDEKMGIFFLGGERVDPGRMNNLKSEAEIFLRSDLWKVLNETITFMAYQHIFVKSNSFEDVLSGKMWLYHMDIQKKLMNTMRRFKLPPPKA